MSEHTKEPWFTDGIDIMARTGEMSHAHVAQVNHNDEDARRIVACVNACEGIGTEFLEKYSVKEAGGLRRVDLIEQRDQLLAALEQLCDSIQYIPLGAGPLQNLSAARAAIAAVKGGA
jgi:hypothetical protein